MRAARVLNWKWGGILLSAGMTGLIISAVFWSRGSGYSVLGPMMLVFLALSTAGILLLGEAMGQVVLREILKGRGLKVRVNAVYVSRRKGRNLYRIYAKCISTVTCEEIWVASPLLLDDPNPCLKDGVILMIDTKYSMKYMLIENLA